MRKLIHVGAKFTKCIKCGLKTTNYVEENVCFKLKIMYKKHVCPRCSQIRVDMYKITDISDSRSSVSVIDIIT